ncbi:hypothetical protein [Spirosoma rigui]|uniref:hypothetical protein n=1 Tax=Spirosoma rigui TaxID=564064 RepID=UPI0012D2A07B|nr:hypothetical protein [Spirosoma rigui]
MTIQEQKVGTWAGFPAVGFVARLKLVPADQVVNLLTPDQLPTPGKPFTVNKAGILVEVGTTVYELNLRPAQTTFKQDEIVDVNGTSYALSIEADVPTSPDLVKFLQLNRARRWLAIWIDLTGQAYVAGQANKGFTLTHQRSLTSINSTQLSLRARCLNPTWYLESFLSSELFPDAAFDHSFAISFDS